MQFLFLQTCDVTYRRMIEATSQTVREYCSRYNLSYDCYFGILRGYHPWHAAYNRILLLERLVKSNFSGWVCYLDADAFIVDLNFDIASYLSDKSHIALIAAAGGLPRVWWNINDGIFFINLTHDVGKMIVQEWAKEFYDISDEQLRAAKDWSTGTQDWSSITGDSTKPAELLDDQEMLWRVLQRVPGAEQATRIEDTEPLLINYHGSFIQQYLRASGSFDDRVKRLQASARVLLGKSAESSDVEENSSLSNDVEGVDRVVRVTEDMIREIYRGILDRDPENDGVVRLHAMSGRSLSDTLRSTVNCDEFLARFRQRGRLDLLADGIYEGDEDLLRRYLDPGNPHEDFVTTFIGTRTRTTLAEGLRSIGGAIWRDIPTRIGDIAAASVEYVGVIKAVEAGTGAFVMAELGAGLGTWSVIGGHLARKAGRGPIRLYAVEASAERSENLKINFADNGFDPEQHTVIGAVVGPRDGYALFPRIDALRDWGESAMFVETAEPRPDHDVVRSISPVTLLLDEPLVDLVHFDIQGAEADVVSASLEMLNTKVRYMVIGTHGREIEYSLLTTLRSAGWLLEHEQPALFDRTGGQEGLRADGTHVWRNPRLS